VAHRVQLDNTNCTDSSALYGLLGSTLTVKMYYVAHRVQLDNTNSIDISVLCGLLGSTLTVKMLNCMAY
jgi:hypothetical protein